MSKSSDNDIYSVFKNAGQFLMTILIITIIVCLQFSFGSFILFACKLAQSNILPTDIKCKPYTENSADIKPIETNIFVVKPPKTNELFSQKIKFPYNETNSKNMIIDAIRNLKETPDSFFLTNYFSTIFENLLCFNYYALNVFFSGANQYLNESIILILGPLLFPIIFTLLIICNNLYLIYLWFEKMSWFFKKNINNPYEERKPEWKNVSLLEPVSYCFAFCLVFFFFILFFIAFWLLFPLLSFLAVSWCVLSLIGYKGIMNGKETTILNIISNVFKYHKVTFMTVLSLLIIIFAFSNLGGFGGLMCLITVILIYFQIIPSNIYIQEIPLNLTELVSNIQAKKTCKAIGTTRAKHGFLYDLFIPQKGGASDLIQEIKKIGKKI